MVNLTQILQRNFRYWKRYVERETLQGYSINKPLRGEIIVKKKNIYYSEHRPWTDEAKQLNAPGKKHKKVWLEPIKDWTIFKGDRVEILVGRDKGKQGLITSLIKERNWCLVQGLNCKYELVQYHDAHPGQMLKKEKPLLVTTEIKLVDPGDLQGTDVEWRFTEQGEKVRVSVRTGRIIPLPREADEYYDFVLPADYKPEDKDTVEKELLEVTFEPKLMTCEEEIMQSLGIKEDRKKAETYWY